LCSDWKLASPAELVGVMEVGGDRARSARRSNVAGRMLCKIAIACRLHCRDLHCGVLPTKAVLGRERQCDDEDDDRHGDSGDVDDDFVSMMTPHHQGAIKMAQAELRYGHNKQLRRLAQEIIVTQQEEIAAMRLALGQPLPPSVPPPDQLSRRTPTIRNLAFCIRCQAIILMMSTRCLLCVLRRSNRASNPPFLHRGEESGCNPLGQTPR
jgi:Domain of unknown function (DUF305)